MGNSSSKAARKLPKLTGTPPWAGARTLPPAECPRTRWPENRASDVKTEAIERDAQDPHFSTKLGRLGPVQVDHHMQAVRLVPDANELLKSRQESEHKALESQLSKNYLHSRSLSNVLDERKSATSRSDLQRLAQKYGIDAWKLENLTRFVSSPSVQGGGAVRTVTKEGEESITMTAVWIEPDIPV